MEKAKSKLTTIRRLICQLCNQSNAVSKCMDCNNGLRCCEKCIDKHNSKTAFRHHTVIKLSDKNQKNNRCRIHTHLSVTQVCKTCEPKTPLCIICVIDHSDAHEVVELEKEAALLRSSLHDSLKTAKAKDHQLQEYMRRIKTTFALQDTALKDVTEDIHRRASLLSNMIRKQEENFLQDAKSHFDKAKAEFNLGAFESEHTTLGKVIADIERVVNSSDVDCVSVPFLKIQEQIKHIMGIGVPPETTHYKKIVFKPGGPTHGVDFGSVVETSGAIDTKSDLLVNPSKRHHEADTPSTASTSTPISLPKKKKSASLTSKLVTGVLNDWPMVPDIKIEEISQIPSHRELPRPKPIAATHVDVDHIYWDIVLQGPKQDIVGIYAKKRFTSLVLTLSEDITVQKAVPDFMDFIGMTPIILVGNDILKHKCSTLLNALRACKCMDRFEKVVIGFIDVHKLLALNLPIEVKYDIGEIYKHYFGNICNTDTPLQTLEALKEIVVHICPDRNERLQSSFKPSHIDEVQEYQAKRKSDLSAWKSIIDNHIISKHIADKAAASGLRPGHMQFVLNSSGKEGLFEMLKEPTENGKPRVSNKRDILDKLANYFDEAKRKE